MLEKIRSLGALALDCMANMGVAFIFFCRVVFVLPKKKVRAGLLLAQIHNVGVLSLIIILTSSLFIGMVLGLQGYIILSKFGADNAVGQLIALSLVRELGPVVSALLFAGRAGSALTAEIGLMKATEQLSSLEVMGVDPIRRVASPRFWAGQICLPILNVIFIVTAVYGGALVCVSWLGVDAGSFWSNMRESVSITADITNGIIKSFVFATVIMWIAIYQGFSCEETSYGIGRATTKTVVMSSVAILILDFFITAVMFGGFKI